MLLVHLVSNSALRAVSFDAAILFFVEYDRSPELSRIFFTLIVLKHFSPIGNLSEANRRWSSHVSHFLDRKPTVVRNSELYLRHTQLNMFFRGKTFTNPTKQIFDLQNKRQVASG